MCVFLHAHAVVRLSTSSLCLTRTTRRSKTKTRRSKASAYVVLMPVEILIYCYLSTYLSIYFYPLSGCLLFVCLTFTCNCTALHPANEAQSIGCSNWILWIVRGATLSCCAVPAILHQGTSCLVEIVLLTSHSLLYAL